MNGYAKNRRSQEDFERSNHHCFHTQLPQQNGRKLYGAIWKVASAWPRLRRPRGPTKSVQNMSDPLVNAAEGNKVHPD
jgi:hypothetical protein